MENTDPNKHVVCKTIPDHTDVICAHPTDFTCTELELQKIAYLLAGSIHVSISQHKNQQHVKITCGPFMVSFEFDGTHGWMVLRVGKRVLPLGVCVDAEARKLWISNPMLDEDGFNFNGVNLIETKKGLVPVAVRACNWDDETTTQAPQAREVTISAPRTEPVAKPAQQPQPQQPQPVTDHRALRAQAVNLDWIFAHGSMLLQARSNPTEYTDRSISALAGCLGIRLHVHDRSGIQTHRSNINRIFDIAAPFLETGDKNGWVMFCMEQKTSTKHQRGAPCREVNFRSEEPLRIYEDNEGKVPRRVLFREERF